MASSDSLSPTAVIGGACSQSPECGEAAARSLALFIYLFVEKVHMKETKQMALQLDRKVHDSNTCPTLKHKIHSKIKTQTYKNMSNMRFVRH